MQFSHELTLKQIRGLPRPPFKKDEIDMQWFRSCVYKCGVYCRYISLSRIISLDPIETPLLLSMCQSLKYLDLSYTPIGDLKELKKLPVLSSLSIAGNKLLLNKSDFEPLSELHNLELISLRNTQFEDISILSGLIKLRSLDLGNCKSIKEITYLSNNTRLEELLLDKTSIITDSNAIASLATLEKLPNLRILNIYHTIMSEDITRVERSVSEYCYIDTEPQELKFVEAICNNHIEDVRRHIDCGMDINVRIGPYAKAYLVDIFRHRCEHKGPFFDCCHEEMDHRPTPVHLAILLNSQETLAALVYAGADVEARAVFTDMKEHHHDGNLVVDHHKSEEYLIMRNMKLGLPADYEGDEGVLYNAEEVLQVCIDRNLHRIVSGLRHRKIYNWREITDWGHTRMTQLLNGEIYKDGALTRLGEKPREARSLQEKQQFAIEEAMAKATISHEKQEEKNSKELNNNYNEEGVIKHIGDDKEKENKGINEEVEKKEVLNNEAKTAEKNQPPADPTVPLEPKKRSSRLDAVDLMDDDERSGSNSESGSGSGSGSDSESGSYNENESKNSTKNQQKAAKKLKKQRSNKNTIMPGQVVIPPKPKLIPLFVSPYAQRAHELLTSNPITLTKPKELKPRVWEPYDGTAQPWQTCGLVTKLTGKPIELVNHRGKLTQALGYRTYFMESKGQTLHLRHEEQDAIKRKAKFKTSQHRTKKIDPYKFTDINKRKGEVERLAAKEYSYRSALRSDLTDDED